MRSVKVTTQLYRKLFSTFHERLPSLKPEILKRLQKECANVRALAKPPTRYAEPCGRAPRMQNLLEITVHFLPPVQMAMISGGSNVLTRWQRRMAWQTSLIGCSCSSNGLNYSAAKACLKTHEAELMPSICCYVVWTGKNWWRLLYLPSLNNRLTK